MKLSKKKKLGLALIILVVIFISWSLYSYFNDGFARALISGNTSEISSMIQSFGIWAGLIFFVIIVLECVLAPFPPFILYIAGGAIFGGFEAGLIATFANMVGAAIAFKISRIYGRRWTLNHIPKEIMEKVEAYISKYGSASIFLLRLNPLTSTDFISYAAGLTKMNFKKFLLWTTLALAPSIFAQTLFGQEIIKNPLLLKFSIIAAIIYVVVFFIIYFLYLKHRKKRKLI